jgi:hypothetical protein
MSDVSQADPFPPDLGSSLPRQQFGYKREINPPGQAVGDEVRQEPFVPSRNDRPYSQWGTPDFALAGAQNYPGVSPGPMMPQANDFPGLIHGAVMALGRFGSRYSGMPAIAMGTYANAFWNAYNAGMKERAQENWQQYQRSRQMTIDRQNEENQAYAEVYAAYHDESGKITDPNAFAQALAGIASKYHDATILNALSNGQFGMIDRILGAKDAVVQNLQKAAHQEERQRLIDEDRRQLMEERRQRMEAARRKEQAERERYRKLGLPYPGPDASTVPPETTTPETTEPESTDTTAPPSTDTTAEETGPTTPPDETSPTTTGQAPATAQRPAQPSPYTMPPANQYIDNAARARVMGRKGPIDKIGEDAVNARVDAYRRKLSELANAYANNPDLTQDEKTAGIDKALRSMNLPELADDLKTYLAGNYQSSLRGDLQPLNELIFNLGTATGSSVTPDTQKTRAAAKAAYARGGPEARNLLSLGTAAYHIAEFKKTMGPDGKNIPSVLAGLAKYGGILGPIPGWLANKKDRDTAIELDGEASIALREVERSLVGGVGTQKDRDEVAALGDWKTMGREATVKSIETVEKMFKDRFIAARNQFIGQMGGTEKDFLSMLDKSFGNDPDSQAAKQELRRLNDETKDQKARGPDLRPSSSEIEGARRWLADPKNANDPRRQQIEQMIGQ